VAERILIGAATAPLTGVGIFLGLDGSDYEFRAGDPAGSFIHWDATNLTISGAVITLGSGSSPGIQGWTQDLVFSPTDNDTVAWASGTLTLADGTAFSISGGNTGNMTAVTYIYLDTAVSTTAYQTSTTATDSVGANKILVAVAEDVADAAKDAEFVVYGGSGDVGVSKTILASVIAADVITFNEIAGNTITGAEINTMNLTAKTLTADTGIVGGWTLSGGELSSGNTAIDATGQIIRMGATAFSTTAGIWMGLDGGVYKFRVGNPAVNQPRLVWDGTTLSISERLLYDTGALATFEDGAGVVQGSIYGTLRSINIDALNVCTFEVGSVPVAEIALAGFFLEAGKAIFPRSLDNTTYYHGTVAATHAFVVSNTERLLVNASGITVTGQGVFSNSVTIDNPDEWLLLTDTVTSGSVDLTFQNATTGTGAAGFQVGIT
ncbi:hypothetical protein LCGC14_2700460, partial [marine sediment metagenome]